MGLVSLGAQVPSLSWDRRWLLNRPGVAPQVKPALVLSPAPPSGLLLSDPVFGRNHYSVLILCLWVSERMAASGCRDLVVGRMSCWGSLESGQSSQHSFIFSSSTKSVSTESQSPLVSEGLFSSVSSLPLPFLSSSVLSFSVQIRLWDSCPKPFIWTVYRVNMSSCDPWWLEQTEQARRESPVAPYGLLGPGQYKPQEWLARMGVSCRHPCHPQFL